jgi:hypothetical protein
MEAAHVELGTDRLMCTQERTGDEIDTDLTRRLGTDGAAAAWVGGRRQSPARRQTALRARGTGMRLV